MTQSGHLIRKQNEGLDEEEMESERPKIVTVAIVILAVSLTYRAYSEFVLLDFLYAGEDVLLLIGWAMVPVSIYAFQAWVLWKVARGRNWARIVAIVVVLLRVGLAAFILASPFRPILGSPLIAIIPVIAEVIAVILLLLAGSFFRPSKSVV